RRSVRRGVENHRHGPGRCLVGLPAGQQGHRSRLGHAEVRQLQHENQGVLWTELQIARAADVPRLLALLLAALIVASPALGQSQNDGFLAALGALREASFSDKEKIVERLSESGHASARPVLAAWLDDRLYVRQPDQKIFIVKTTDDSLASFDLIDPVSLKDAGSATREDLTKIGTNNHVRRQLKIAVARFDLSSSDTTVRLAAVQQMLRALDEPSIALLRKRVGLETDAAVKAEIETGLALVALDDGDPK